MLTRAESDLIISAANQLVGMAHELTTHRTQSRLNLTLPQANELTMVIMAIERLEPFVALEVRSANERFRTAAQAAPTVYNLQAAARRVRDHRLQRVVRAPLLLRQVTMVAPLRDRMRGFLDQVEDIGSIRGMHAALSRYGRRLRDRRSTELAQPVTEMAGLPGQEPLRVGEFAGMHQIVSLEPFSGQGHNPVHAINTQTGGRQTMSIRDWLNKRQDVRNNEGIRRHIISNPIMQFGYGFAEGVGESMQGTIEFFANFRQALSQIARAIGRLASEPGETITELARSTLEAILDWGRRFAAADGLRRARMSGRLLGAAFFEIISEFGGGRVASALRHLGGAMRSAQSMTGIVRLLDRGTDLTVRLRRATRTRITAAGRRLLGGAIIASQRAAAIMPRTFYVANALLEVGRELVRGTVRRLADPSGRRTMYVFLPEEGDRMLVSLGGALETPEGIGLHVRGRICAAI